MRRFPLSQNYNIGDQFEVSSDTSLHLLKVLRLKDGDQIEATDGNGYIYTIQLLLSNKILEFLILSKEKSPEIPIHTKIFIAELKHPAMELAISIASEHGVNEIIPFFSDYSIPLCKQGTSNEKKSRRKKIVLETSKKVGGTFGTNILESIEFKTIINYCIDIETKIVFWEQHSDNSNLLAETDWSKKHVIVIGPEGGFSKKELDKFVEWDFHMASLGSRILRSPQAVGSALSLIRYFTEHQALKHKEY